MPSLKNLFRRFLSLERGGKVDMSRITNETSLFSSPFFNTRTYEYVLSMIDVLASKPDTLGVPRFNPYWDARRAAITIEYIKEFNLAKGLVLEIGSPQYLVSQIIWSAFPGVTPLFTSNDLRYERIAVGDSEVDAVICLEVIEHLSDWPYREATTLNGLFFFLEEIYRVLKVGGRALFTTPNACSLWIIMRALLGQPPMLYEWHFREYTPEEIRQILEYIGFKIVAIRTEYVWHLWNFQVLVEFMEKNGFDLSMRGDDIFVVAEKPSRRVRIPHRLALPVGRMK